MSDIEDWFAPMDADTFWIEAALFDLIDDLPARAACEADIAAGVVSAADALKVLKIIARYHLTLRQNLVRDLGEPLDLTG